MTVHLYGKEVTQKETSDKIGKFYTFSDKEKDIIALALVSYRESVKDILSFSDNELFKSLIRLFSYRDS